MLLVFALAVAACSAGKVDDDGPPPEPPTTPAAALRVTLDSLLREHVFLLGLATENAVTRHESQFDGASEALEENALAIADQFEKAYAEKGEKGFLEAWRPYIDLIGRYAGRKARKFPIGNIDKAFGSLSGKFGVFAAGLTPLINARVMGTRMRDMIDAIRAVIDAQVAKDYKKADQALRTASDRAAGIGAIFARAFADDVPMLYQGDPSSPAAELRSTLAGALVEHVYLVGFTTENGLTGEKTGRDGAKATLDASSAALAKQIGGAYGGESEKAFAEVWKRQNDLLISYADAAKDPAKRDAIRDDLERYATDLVRFLLGLNRSFDVLVLEDTIVEHGQAMTQAIDAQASGNFKLADLRLRAAAQRFEALAVALAEVTVRRFPDRFRSTPAGVQT